MLRVKNQGKYLFEDFFPPWPMIQHQPFNPGPNNQLSKLLLPSLGQQRNFNQAHLYTRTEVHIALRGSGFGEVVQIR